MVYRKLLGDQKWKILKHVEIVVALIAVVAIQTAHAAEPANKKPRVSEKFTHNAHSGEGTHELQATALAQYDSFLTEADKKALIKIFPQGFDPDLSPIMATKSVTCDCSKKIITTFKIYDNDSGATSLYLTTKCEGTNVSSFCDSFDNRL